MKNIRMAVGRGCGLDVRGVWYGMEVWNAAGEMSYQKILASGIACHSTD